MALEIRQKAENRSKRLVRQKYIKLANLWTQKIFRDREIWGGGGLVFMGFVYILEGPVFLISWYLISGYLCTVGNMLSFKKSSGSFRESFFAAQLAHLFPLYGTLCTLSIYLISHIQIFKTFLINFLFYIACKIDLKKRNILVSLEFRWTILYFLTFYISDC